MSRAGTIDGPRFAMGREVVTGALAITDLPRLAEMGCETATLQYAVRGGENAGATLAATHQAPVVGTQRRPNRLRGRFHAASMAKLGFQPEPWTRAQYAAFLADEMKQWPPIVKASGVKAE